MDVANGTVIVVLIASGRPSGVLWEGSEYLVTDQPTPLEELLYELTHPPNLVGWRFQGTNDRGRSMMFEIVLRAGEWELVRVYE